MASIMRSGILAFAAAATVSSAAFAADLPRRSVAPVVPMMAAPAWSWTGFYLGANAGYAFQGKDTLGIWGVPGAYQNLGNIAPRGFKGGLIAGYNWQFVGMPLVVGIEGDMNIGGLERKYVGVAGPMTYGATSKIDVDGSLRARLGYSIDRALIYVTGGMAVANNKYNITTTTPAVSVLSNTKTRTGYTVGVGVDYAFSNNLFGGLEYRYTDFGKKTLGNGYINTGAEPNWHQVMARIGYKF